MCAWLLLLLLALSFLFSPAISGDSVTPGTPLTSGQTLVSSPRGTFTLGFFVPAGCASKYLGIWYTGIPVRTVVWVANRDAPVPDSTSATLKIAGNGSLVIVDESAAVVWASSVSSAVKSARNLRGQLRDDGNFVLTSDGGGGVMWQSFEHPTDTLLPGMKLGMDLQTGAEWYINSWLSSDDPAVGEWTFRLDPRGSPELFLYRWSTRTYGSGPWNGYQFTGVPDLKSYSLLSFSFVSDSDEDYYSYEINNSTILTRFVMNSTGFLQRFMWIESTRSWSLFWSYPMDECDTYRVCGPYGVCSVDHSPICGCMHGFSPRFPQEWSLRDGSGGCVRRTELGCAGDGFLRVGNMKLPESANATVDMSMSLDQCRESCLRNCSCRAYASANVSGGGGANGCFIWTDDLLDMRQFDRGGQNLYVRLAAADLPANNDMSKQHSDAKKLVAIIVPASLVLLLGLVGLVICIRKVKNRKKSVLTPLDIRNGLPFRARNQAASNRTQDGSSHSDQSSQNDLDLPLFDIEMIRAATDGFAEDNKIGQGGFGPVYMGKLDDGQDIAVKRLSRRSTQGLREFKNEVKLIAKLQHRNLVRLLGCSIDGGERMLVYEYMHNRSLDTFLFDEEKRAQLSWEKRFNIIMGIARGLLYLHQDSVLRIIHRDLKASNILLDRDMNPKISDFGVARIFGSDQTAAHTKKVVGTYGYMSPEYAMDGVFSTKSDVFSFGVLVLEIISGKKNRGFYHSELDLNLLRYAWRLWKDGRGLEFLDEAIVSLSNSTEVSRCIQIGLLCVQEQPRHRPTMSSVIMMLGSENATLPEPYEPAFSTGRNQTDTATSRSNSVNNLTVTIIQGR